MQYIHVRNLEKYHPGYKDRKLSWAKVYFDMVQGDPEFEMIESEIDKWRFIALVILELEAQSPIPLNEDYLKRKGFDVGKRKIALTLQVLQNFIEVKTQDLKLCGLDVEEDKDKDKEQEALLEQNCLIVFDYFKTTMNKAIFLTPERKKIIKGRLKEGKTVEQLKSAIYNFSKDTWKDRHKYIDIVYCLGVRGRVDNFDRWINSDKKQKENDNVDNWR